jgi:hypothetical protein
VFNEIHEQEMSMQAGLCKEQEKPQSMTTKQKKEIFWKVAATVGACFG